MAWPRSIIAFFGEFKKRPGWALLIGAVNLIGIAYGFSYYRAQFAVTPWYWWPFVPDSPLAVFWAELALFTFWLNRKPGILDSDALRRVISRVQSPLDALAFVGNVQVGLWTIYVLLAYAPEFGTLRGNLNTILLFGHAGMAVLALIFLQGLRERRKLRAAAVALAVTLAGGCYLVNDAMDYFGPHYEVAAGAGPLHTCSDYGLRPYTVPCHPGQEAGLAIVTFGLSIAATLVLVLVIRKDPPEPRSAFKPGRT